MENIFKLYVREVPGQFGKSIKVYKIKTMRDTDLETPSSKRDGLGKIIDDPRITKIGKVFRKYWIDELPQLFYNLPRGDLGLVGIRPRSEKEWDELFSKEHKQNAYKHKPGLFGVHYIDRNIADNDSCFNDLEKLEANYLKEKEAHPIRTNVKYFFKIWYNIIFKRMRSR